MIDAQDKSVPPIVFISYSHDSREHKRWVSKLAESLRARHIEVIFGQWDLEPGDDIPKFMERAVKRADRVLMVCTETYVRKANDGMGGVGYEAMVVTSEIVRDLGTRKFIPVVRQSGENPVVPDCVATRLYVNFSEEADFEESLGKLTETIHKVTGYFKPPLGPDPFADLKVPNAVVTAHQLLADAPFSKMVDDPLAAYERACAIASEGDLVAWRRLIKALERKALANLERWKLENPSVPNLTEEDPQKRFDHAGAGVRCYMPFFAALVAGAESGKVEFCGQLGWIDEVARPPGWNTEGSIYWLDFPEMLLFVGQALVGAMLMEAGASKQVYNLGTSRLPKRWRNSESKPLFLDKSVTGWPECMIHSCRIAWNFLLRQIDQQWVTTAFGSSNHALSALVSYYQFLSFLNFNYLSAKGRLDNADMRWAVTVPLNFCRLGEEIVHRGYRNLLSHREMLIDVLEQNELQDSIKLARQWTLWITECGRWLSEVFGWHLEFEIPQASLPSDLIAKPLRIADL
jgi:hypothetical protein